MSTAPSKEIATFPNPAPSRDYVITCESAEFTCLCPETGQPDFATIVIKYVPDRLCIELKSLKLYLWSYRNEGAYHEAVTNKILNDLAGVCKPRWMEIETKFNIRGGISTNITASYGKKPIL
jgi:7-cyano-7-deazaguanine reductase